MLHAFVYNEVGVLVRHWFEVDLDDSHLEHGTRVELRLLGSRAHRGSESAAQEIVLDQPLWRADLFDRLDGLSGSFDAAHYHPYFTGAEPCGRHWDDEIKTDPWSWLGKQLSDIDRIAGVAGATLRAPVTESALVSADAPGIMAAARSRAPELCRDKEQCHAWAGDASDAVQLMLDSLQRPDLLDHDRVAPWRRPR